MELTVGIILAIALIIFLSYSFLMIKHAARFRYLSSRTVYLTVAYVAICTTLILLSIATYLALVFN